EHNFAGRETGHNGDNRNQPTWRVCVIDELANFRVGSPSFAIILACLNADQAAHAVVITAINVHEFSASCGRGAQLNDRRNRGGGEAILSDAIAGYTQPLGNNEAAFDQRERLMRLMSKAFDLRNIGSNALSMCYVAADRFQGALLSNVDEFALNAAGL